MNEELVNRYGQAINAARRDGNEAAAAQLESELGAKMTPEASPMAKIGAGFQDVATAFDRWRGTATKEDTAEQNKYAQRADPAGWHRMAGQALPMSLAAMIPGANTVLGAATIGGGIGAFMNPDDPLKQGAIGAATGGLVQKGFNALPNAVAGLKNQIAQRTPFLQGTKQEIAEKAFIESIPKSERAAVLTETYNYQSPKNIPGFQQTTASASRNPTMLAAQRQLLEAGGEHAAPLRNMVDDNAVAVNRAWEGEFGGGKAAAASKVAGDFAEQATSGMPLDMQRLTKPNAFMSVFKDLENRINTAGSSAIKNKLIGVRDDLYLAVQSAQKTGNIEPLHVFRMTALDDAIATMSREGANKQAKVLRNTLGKMGVEGAFDQEMNRMTGNKWDQFLKGFYKRKLEATQREAGEEWLTKLGGKPQTSSGEAMATSLRPQLRQEIAGGMVDDFGQPRYTKTGEDLLRTTSGEMEQFAAPYAPNIGPRGSATAENLNPMNAVLENAKGSAKAAADFSGGEIGTALAGLVTGQLWVTAGALAKHYGMDRAKAAATADVARRMVQLYQNPQAAAAVLNQSMLQPAEKAIAKQIAEKAVPLLAQGAAVGATNAQ